MTGLFAIPPLLRCFLYPWETRVFMRGPCYALACEKLSTTVFLHGLKSSRSLHFSKTYFDTDLLPVWHTDETGTATEPLRLNGHTKTGRAKRTRAACVFPGRNKTEGDFSQTNGKSQTELHKNRPLFLKQEWFRNATSRNHLQKHFSVRETTFWRVPSQPSDKCR